MPCTNSSSAVRSLLSNGTATAIFARAYWMSGSISRRRPRNWPNYSVSSTAPRRLGKANSRLAAKGDRAPTKEKGRRYGGEVEREPVMKFAILDDYQGAAASLPCMDRL